MSTHKSTTSCLLAILLALAAFAPACGGGGGDDNDVDADVEEGIDIEDDVPDAEDGREDRAETEDVVTDDGADADEGGADADDGGEAEVLVTCGDGTVDAGEDCDDGNTVNTDDCTNTCHDATCGDGFIWTGHEACDDGNTTAGDGCSATCALESCGNGTIDAGETCDDGNTIDTDDCPGNCQSASCGDGYVWAGHEDCDGSAPRSCTTTCSSAGTQLCTACAWETACTPPVETCNDADDDCDTAVDNGFPCRIGASVSCTTACSSTGAGTCTGACQLPLPADCMPPVEICNGADDDCDGETDEGYPCIAGATVACTNACGGAGTGLCLADCSLPAAADCSAPPETCNGLDDDCTSGPDDIFACVQGATVPCTTTCLSTGSGTCSTTCDLPTAATCVAPAEVCNGADDDCDTVVDDGFPCTAGASRACTAGTCSGNQSCDATSCTWGTCAFGAGPINDTCGGSLTDISTGGTFVGNTCAAVNDYSNTCGGTIGASPDVVFTLHIASPRDVIIDTVSSGFDGMLFIRHAGTCPGTTADRCDDNSAGGSPGQARIQWTNMPAGDYWVILDGAGAGSRGDYVLNVFVATPPPPANDTCATAIAMGGSGTYNGQTATGTDDHVPSCSATTGGRDVWYSFTLAGREIVYLDVVDGNAWNTVLEVRQGACGGAMTSSACNDDACAGSRSQWFGILPAGTYYVVVDGAGAAQSGAFSLLYQHSGCTGATQITGNGNYDGTTIGAGNDHPSAGCGGGYSADVDYWLALCAPRDVTATTCNTVTTFDSVLIYRQGSCTAGFIACNNDAACAGNPLAATLTSGLPKGLNFITIDGQGYAPAEGPYRITISGM
ncbi:MAG: hypothetical protein HY905_21620 [Deltaproteobacteria bacterium]|nr:hypothetical protein [Deltaproteobacteria bacterium]